MSVNLVSLASQYLTPDLKNRMASALGADRSHVEQAGKAGIPALLGGLAGLASSKEGAQKLNTALNQQSPGILDTLASAIGGGGQKDLVERGKSSLGSLFGGSSVTALSNAVGKFSGLGQSSASSLLGMLAPMVLGLVRKQKVEQGLDAQGLARLLGEQKDHISAAMPAGFKSHLQSAGIPDIAGLGRETVGAERAGGGANRARRSGSRNWLIWAVPLVAILALAAWFFSTRTGEEPDREAAVVEGVDLSAETKTALENVTNTLRQINDEPSARAAVPKLEAANAELDRIERLSNRLPEEGRKALSSVAKSAWPAIDRHSRRALAVPVVESVARPEIEAIRTKVDALRQE